MSAYENVSDRAVMALLNSLHAKFLAIMPYLPRTAGVPNYLWDNEAFCKKTLEMPDLCYAKVQLWLLPPSSLTSKQCIYLDYTVQITESFLKGR